MGNKKKTLIIFPMLKTLTPSICGYDALSELECCWFCTCESLLVNPAHDVLVLISVPEV